jgi:hypothetical protein
MEIDVQRIAQQLVNTIHSSLRDETAEDTERKKHILMGVELLYETIRLAVDEAEELRNG